MESSIVVQQQTVIRTDAGCEEVREWVALEQPWRVALNDKEIGSSMILATALEEFGVGFLFGMGYIDHPAQVKEVLICPEGRISVYADVDEEESPKEVIITSGCGGTGRIPREMLEGRIAALHEYALPFAEAGDFIRQALHASDLGQKTHCVHGCGLWADGRLQVYYEDIGRHNAVDKVIGAILMGRAPARAAVFTTGRLTSDMVLKCARIGVPIVMSRTSTSSLGLAIARQAGVTLVCYARPGRLNIYNAAHRLI